MLLYLTDWLAQYHSAFNVFQYLTMRTILGVLTALLISLLVGPVMIRRLSHHQIGQTVRDDGPESHFSKAGTPTMGEALILLGDHHRHPVVGRPGQPLCLDRADRHPVVRHHRSGRRLQKAGEA